MIYYLVSTFKDENSIKERSPNYTQASKKNRAEYVMSAIDRAITVISIGLPYSKGIFKSQTEINKKVRYYYLPSFNYFGLKHISAMLSFLVYLIKKIHKDDCIISYNVHIDYVLPIILTRPFKKFKIITEFEEIYFNTNISQGIKTKALKFFEKYMLSNSDGYIVTCSNITKLIKNERPILINFGYNSLHGVSIKSDFSNCDKIVLYSGRIDDEGGIEVFLEAIPYIKQKCKVIVTGSGPKKEKLKNFKSDNKQVDFNYLGFVDGETLAYLMSNATICINPLRISYKFASFSFPSKVLQYLTYGNNTLSSRTNGVEKIAELFPNLYLYDSDSPELIAKKVDQLINIPVEREKNLINIKNFFDIETLKLRHFLNQFTTSAE